MLYKCNIYGNNFETKMVRCESNPEIVRYELNWVTQPLEKNKQFIRSIMVSAFILTAWKRIEKKKMN